MEHHQNCKNAKTQKCKKGAKSIFLIDKETHIFCSENEDGKPKIGLYIVRKCAENIPQKVKWDNPNGKWDTPNDEMGYPQMVKWDIPNGKMGYPK